MDPYVKPLYWLGSARKDLKAMPEAVQDSLGYALYLAQTGRKHAQAQPLKGFGSAGVPEIVESKDNGTYRAVYTVTLAGNVYVLHWFQKQSSGPIVGPKLKGTSKSYLQPDA